MPLNIQLTDKLPRECGGCTLCCKLLPMTPELYPPERVAGTVAAMVKAGWAAWEDFAGMKNEFPKPAGEPCPHQRHGKGCTIYSKRPFSCRTWNCRWTTGDDTQDLRRPDRSRYVIDLVPDFVTLAPDDGSTQTNIQVVQIWCDPAHPEAWRDPALLAYIERRAREGIGALIRYNNKEAITVFAPPLAEDGQWHEFRKGIVLAPHSAAEVVNALSPATKEGR